MPTRSAGAARRMRAPKLISLHRAPGEPLFSRHDFDWNSAWGPNNSSADPASPQAAYDRLSIRLAKPESHPVGPADRIIFCVVKVRVIWLGALRCVGGDVQTPKGWSLVSFGLAL